MKRVLGKVIDVYIPEEYKDGELLDIYYRHNIGFKIKAGTHTYTFETTQDDISCDIRRNTKVTLTFSGDQVTSIERYRDEK